MARKHRWRIGTATLFAVSLAACADQSSSPLEPRAVSGAKSSTQTTSWTAGDSLFAQFNVTPAGGTYNIVGRKFRIDFPAGAICDIPTSSYGPGTWDEPCVSTAQTVKVSTKIWLDADGHPHIDFQPAMRFQPTLANGVVLYLKDRNAQYQHDLSILYCVTDGGCRDESLIDPSLQTMIDSADGIVYRRIKHFSGYNVTAGRAADAEVVEGTVSLDSSLE
jgi:hypothetical protein